MKCVACGLDNDPALRYCDSCEYPLADSGASPRSTTPTASAKAPVVRAVPLDDDDAEPVSGALVDSAPGGAHPLLLERRSSVRPLVVGGLALLVATAIGGVVWAADGEEPAAPQQVAASPGGNGTETVPPGPLTTTPVSDPPTSAPATTNPGDLRAQARALDRLLSDSKKSRDKLNQGIATAGNCAGIPAALTLMRQAGDERRAEQAALVDLDLSVIADGEAARTALNDALSHSITADEEFVAWADAKRRNGCRDSATARQHYAAAQDHSSRAGEAKMRFLNLWNPVAADVGLKIRDRRGI